jgi:hypothetical protein
MTHQEYADSLRKIADLFEKHTELKLPHDCDQFNYFSANAPSELEKLTRALGKCTKRYDRAFTGSFELDSRIGQIEFRAILNKNRVCKARVVGTKTVPAVVIPERTIPEHQEEIIEWDCSEPLLAGESNG